MTWDRLKDVIQTFTKAQFHALVVLSMGIVLALTGHKDESQLVLGGGLALLNKHDSSGS
jgi:hypothetical protein